MDGKHLERLAQQNDDLTHSGLVGATTSEQTRESMPVSSADALPLDARQPPSPCEFELVPPPAHQPELTFLQLRTPARQSYTCECLDSYERDGMAFYHAYISAAELFRKKLPLDANPRRPVMGAVTEAMKQTLIRTPDRFHILNNGITVIADSVEIAPVETSAGESEPALVMEMAFGKKENHSGFGICNGGHTYMSILTLPTCPDEAATVHVEIIVLPKDMTLYKKTNYIKDIARARNSHSQLRTTTEANYAGLYDYIRSFLGDELDRQVRWMEGDRAAVKDAIDAQAFISALCALSPSWFTHALSSQTRTHKKAAKSPGAVHCEWIEQQESRLAAELDALVNRETNETAVDSVRIGFAGPELADPSRDAEQAARPVSHEQTGDVGTYDDDETTLLTEETRFGGALQTSMESDAAGECQAEPAIDGEPATSATDAASGISNANDVSAVCRDLNDIAPLASDVFDILDMVSVSLYNDAFKGAKKAYRRSKLWKIFGISHQISRGQYTGRKGSVLGPPYQVMFLGLFRWNVWIAHQPEFDIERPLVGWMRDNKELWDENKVEVISQLQDLTESYTEEAVKKELADETAAYADTLQLIKLQYGKSPPQELLKAPHTFWAPGAQVGEWVQYIKADDSVKAEAKDAAKPEIFLHVTLTAENVLIATLFNEPTTDAVPYTRLK